MNNKKQVPNVNLQKTSVIFMQLGLILALFIVYVIIELESDYKIPQLAIIDDGETDDEPRIREFEIEKRAEKKKTFTEKVKKVKASKQELKPAEKFETVDDNTQKPEDIFDSTEDDDKPIEPKQISLDDIPEVDPDERGEEELPFNKVEFAPEYPGCNKGTQIERKACFNKKINKFVNKKFNTGLAQQLGLSEGKQRISVQFIIDKKGDIIDVKVRAPHKKLEREAKRIINLLPKMKPARQGTGNPNVRFNLPINFVIE